MMNSVAQNNDSLYKYTFKKLTLIRKLKLPISPKDQVSLVLGEISDNHIKITVEATGIKDVSELSRHFKALDERQGRIRTETPVNSGSSVIKQQTASGLSVSIHRKISNKKLFSKCNQERHFKKDCNAYRTHGIQKRDAIEYNVNYVGSNSNDKLFKDNRQ